METNKIKRFIGEFNYKKNIYLKILESRIFDRMKPIPNEFYDCNTQLEFTEQQRYYFYTIK
ncbi:unnamed protein product [Paramecium primaurelia]|uniref:Uncharacterized protein n=1 Tax=Paramecium primaurelia TaxID=5886 RepID=A0A8S1Q150_PARPR|nr:unnamed protein product [Paramecium primaurelia]